MELPVYLTENMHIAGFDPDQNRCSASPDPAANCF